VVPVLLKPMQNTLGPWCGLRNHIWTSFAIGRSASLIRVSIDDLLHESRYGRKKVPATIVPLSDITLPRILRKDLTLAGQIAQPLGVQTVITMVRRLMAELAEGKFAAPRDPLPDLVRIGNILTCIR
jgi:hypothetical protein